MNKKERNKEKETEPDRDLQKQSTKHLNVSLKNRMSTDSHGGDGGLLGDGRDGDTVTGGSSEDTELQSRRRAAGGGWAMRPTGRGSIRRGEKKVKRPYGRERVSLLSDVKCPVKDDASYIRSSRSVRPAALKGWRLVSDVTPTRNAPPTVTIPLSVM